MIDIVPMDPQAANNLDPKLQETYNKVMGTTTTPTPATPNASPAPTAAPASDIPSQNATPPATDASQNMNASIPQAPYTADNLSFQAAIQQPANNPAAPLNVTPPQQTSSLLRILYIVGAVVFFVVYTFVWIKIFNLPLPF